VSYLLRHTKSGPDPFSVPTRDLVGISSVFSLVIHKISGGRDLKGTKANPLNVRIFVLFFSIQIAHIYIHV
jgi:hypothetical protein